MVFLFFSKKIFRQQSSPVAECGGGGDDERRSVQGCWWLAGVTGGAWRPFFVHVLGVYFFYLLFPRLVGMGMAHLGFFLFYICFSDADVRCTITAANHPLRLLATTKLRERASSSTYSALALLRVNMSYTVECIFFVVTLSNRTRAGYWLSNAGNCREILSRTEKGIRGMKDIDGSVR